MKTALALGLRGRLILLILVAFILIFAMIVQHTIAHRNEKITHAATDLLHDAQLIAAQQQQTQARADTILLNLMTHAELRLGVSAEACTRFLATFAEREPAFLQIGKTLPNGDVVCAAKPPVGRVNLADRSWFHSVLKSENMVVSGVMNGRILKQPIVVFSRAMRDDDGRVTGVLYLSLDLNWLRLELAQNAHTEDARLVVVDANGQVVARHPDNGGWVGKSATQTPLFQAIIAHGGQGTIEEKGLEGEPRIIAFTPFLDAVSGPMTLWLSVPKAVVVAPIQRELTISLSIAATVLLLVIALVVWGGEKLVVGPLRRLNLAVARFGSGDLSARTGLSYSEDDIGRLAHTFDTMAKSVQNGEQKLARANHALRVISAGNRAMLRCTTKQELMEDMCRSLVEAGGYLFAWVGYAEHDPDKRVQAVASWNAPEGFLDGLNLSWDEMEPDPHPTGTAIRRGIPIAENNLLTGLNNAPLWELAHRYGFASMLTMPLWTDDVAIGALNIYATEPDAFDESVVELLSESAADLAFGIATLRDEAEQNRTQVALKTAEERFRAVAQASLDALFILKSIRGEHNEILDFEFIDLNPSAEQMLSMARGDVIGQKLCGLIPASRTVGFFDRYVAVVNTGTPLDEEFSIDMPGIKAKWIRQQVVRVGNGVAISSRDITQWKQLSAEIKQQDRLRKQILNSSGEGIFGLDAEGYTTFVNPAAMAMLQWTEEELIGKPMHALHHHTRADGTPYPGNECPIHAAYRDGNVHRVDDEVFWRKDGTSYPVEYVSTPVLDDQGILRGAVVSFNDISKRKAHERALTHAVRTLKTLSEVNQVLVRARDEAQLLKEVCKGIVEKGSYRMAWVAYADDNPEKTITPKAWAGVEEGYLGQLDLTWADTERGQGPSGRAIRSGEAQVIHDIRSDPGFAPWRELAEKHGYSGNFTYPLEVAGKIIGALGIYAAETNAFDEAEIELLKELGGDLAFGIETLRTRAERDLTAYQHQHHAEILRHNLEDSLRAIATVVEMRDPYTAGHERRVGELAVAIAQEMGLDEDKIHGIRLAASVHDLGKINVPAEILSKPGRLSDIEFMLIKTHAQAGYDILKDVEFPWPIADIVWQHHERLDGTGYPQGIKGGQILIESRIMAVADVTEAMASHRPYRAGLGIDVALKEIERGKGRAYDPEVADACLKLFREGGFAFQGGM